MREGEQKNILLYNLKLLGFHCVLSIQSTQNSLCHSQRDKYTIFSDTFLPAIQGTRAANSRAQLFLMTHMTTNFKPFQIPVLRSHVFPDVLLLIWQFSIWCLTELKALSSAGRLLTWKHTHFLTFWLETRLWTEHSNQGLKSTSNWCYSSGAVSIFN